MQNKNFKSDDGLYELINVSDNFDEVNSSRTDDLIYNSNPINWHRKVCVHGEYSNNYHMNGNNSSVLPENDKSFSAVQSALRKNAVFDLPLPCKNNLQSFSEITPRSQFCNEKYRQNIEILLPQKLTNDLKLSYDTDFTQCPECKTRNLSYSDWCLSCGLFLIKKKYTNSFSIDNKKSESENNIINNISQKIILTENEYFKSNEIINDSITFDKYYKRNNPNDGVLSNQLTKDNNSTAENLSMPNHEDIRLNISQLNSVREETPNFELDIDICERALNKPIIAHSTKLPMIPPLDLSNLECFIETEKKPEKVVKHKKVSKENEKRFVRKWASSSMSWDDKPVNLLKKKPAKYYRNKSNSCTNKIGLHVYPSRIESDLTMLSGDNINLTNNHSKFLNDSIDINPEENDLLNETGENGLIDNCRELLRWINVDVPQSDETHNKNNCNISELLPSFDNRINSNVASNWQCLPAEIWIKIMIYLSHSELSRLQRTCRRIYSIGLDSQLWRSVTLFRHSNLTDYHIINIAQKKPKELHFKNCFGTSITLNGLKEMFKICGQGVEKLSFISCSKGALEGDHFLLLSADFCPNVTHINASYLMNLQDSTLISMTKGFNKIVSLNLMGAHSISNESIKSLIKNHRSSLISLDLYGCFRLNSGTLRILEECLNLKSLALGSINKLKRTSMVDLLRKLSKLTNLDLRGTMNLIDDSLLGQICALCPNLQQIVLTNSCLVGDQGLNSLANSNVSKTLKVLDICGCSRISDKGVEAILKTCQSLEDLDISCTGITGRITKLFNMYPPPNLKCLRVNNNKLISETELASIVKSSKKLNTVYMCGITSIDTWRSLEAKYQHILFKHE